MHQYRLRSNCLGSSSAEKDLGVLKDTELNISQQCTLAARRPTTSWDVLVRVSKLKKVIFPCLAHVRPHMKCCVYFGVPQYKRDMDILE